MKLIPRGYKTNLDISVTDEMCAILDGQLIHRVYSTFWMINHMELAARQIIIPFLEPDEEAVGTSVCVKHIAPTPVGMRVSIQDEIKEIKNKEVICYINAFNDLGKIGEGTQTQTVLSKNKLHNKISKLYNIV